VRVQASRALLADTLAWVGRAVPKNPPVPVLSGIHITATPGKGDALGVVTISGQDYETSHTAEILADVTEGGECLVPSRFLTPLLAALNGRDVTLVAEDETGLVITSGRSKYKARLFPLGDYPSLPSLPERTVAVVDRDHLMDALARVGHAAAREDTFNLHVVNLYRDEGGELLLQATNRHVAARASIPCDGGDAGPVNAVFVPGPFAAALKGLAGPIAVAVDDGLVGLAGDGRSVTMRQVDAKYPTLGHLFGTKQTMAAELDVDEFRNAVKRTLLVIDDHAAVDLVALNITAGQVEIAADGDTADGSEVVDADTEDELLVKFNGSYVANVLGAVTTDRVHMSFSAPNKLVGFTPVGHDSTSFIIAPRSGLK
jgi:DNA polymerase-3 subunit beta